MSVAIAKPAARPRRHPLRVIAAPKSPAAEGAPTIAAFDVFVAVLLDAIHHQPELFLRQVGRVRIEVKDERPLVVHFGRRHQPLVIEPRPEAGRTPTPVDLTLELSQNLLAQVMDGVIDLPKELRRGGLRVEGRAHLLRPLFRLIGRGRTMLGQRIHR